jgi:hypothetical protein
MLTFAIVAAIVFIVLGVAVWLPLHRPRKQLVDKAAPSKRPTDLARPGPASVTKSPLSTAELEQRLAGFMRESAHEALPTVSQTMENASSKGNPDADRSGRDSGENEHPIDKRSTLTLSRAELEHRLDVLAKSPRPVLRELGAMCYAFARLPNTEDYVCPRCGETTSYAVSELASKIREIRECRYHLDALNELDASLDEVTFCATCSPEVDSPVLALELRDSDGKLTRTENIKGEDLFLLVQFLKGSTVYRSGDEYALIDHLPRIRQLLGSSVDDEDQKERRKERDPS